jgi:hypothetical protein
MTTTADIKGKAQATTSATADQSRHVGQVAAEEAGHVAEEAMHQAHGLIEEAKGQLTDQSRTQRDRLVGTLRTFSDDLDQLTSGESAPSGLASDMVRQVAERARQLCGQLDGREPAEILDDVRAFARRRPGVFLLGTLAAGVVAGRLARGAREGSGSSPASNTASLPTPSDTAATTDVAADTSYGATTAGLASADPGLAGTSPATVVEEPVVATPMSGVAADEQLPGAHRTDTGGDPL